MQMLSANLKRTVTKLPAHCELSEREPCLLGVVASVRDKRRARGNSKQEAMRALRWLAQNPTTDAVYIFYAPETGKHLTQPETAALFHNLQAAARGELQAG